MPAPKRSAPKQPSSKSGLSRKFDRPLWDDAHVRVTFHCPRNLLAALDAEVERTGDSKTRIIVDALGRRLGWARPKEFQ